MGRTIASLFSLLDLCASPPTKNMLSLFKNHNMMMPGPGIDDYVYDDPALLQTSSAESAPAEPEELGVMDDGETPKWDWSKVFDPMKQGGIKGMEKGRISQIRFKYASPFKKAAISKSKKNANKPSLNPNAAEFDPANNINLNPNADSLKMDSFIEDKTESTNPYSSPFDINENNKTKEEKIIKP